MRKTYRHMNAEERKAYRNHLSRRAKAKDGKIGSSKVKPIEQPPEAPAPKNGNVGFAGYRVVGAFTPAGALEWRLHRLVNAGHADAKWKEIAEVFESPVEVVQEIAREVTVGN